MAEGHVRDQGHTLDRLKVVKSKTYLRRESQIDGLKNLFPGVWFIALTNHEFINLCIHALTDLYSHDTRKPGYCLRW